MLGPAYLEGTYSEIYPDKSPDTEGMQKFFKQFSFPGHIGSHVTPETPGSIHEGGELGYSLSHAYGMSYRLPERLAGAVKDSLDEWQAHGKARRLWQRDATLWSGRDEARWLGWLGITNGELADIQRFTRIAEVARSGAFSHVLLLGMGGSSLGPEVMNPRR